MNALALGMVAALCWGIHDVTVRRVSQNVPLMALLLGVLVVGAVFQFGILVATDGYTPLSRGAVIYSVMAGVAFTVAGAALYAAFHRGPVRVVAPAIGSYPILSVALAHFSGAEVTLWQWLAVLAVVAGIAIVAVFARRSEETYPPIGPTIALSLLAAAGYFSTFALGQEAARLSDELSTIMVTRLASVAVLAPILLVLAVPMWPGRAALPFIVIMGVLDGLALYCVLSAGDLPSAEYAAVASSVFGLITVILARVFLSEGMTLTQWSGVLLTFGAIGYLAL